MAVVDYKNAILDSLKAAQENVGDPKGVIDNVTGYSTGDAWITDNQAITWQAASGGTMDFADGSIILTVSTSAQLLGVAIWSSDAFPAYPTGFDTAAGEAGIRCLVNNGSPIAVDDGDLIRIVGAEIGIGD